MSTDRKDVLDALIDAVVNRESHQQAYYNCGSSCCIAGGLACKNYQKLLDLLIAGHSFSDMLSNTVISTMTNDECKAWDDPWEWAGSKYNLSDIFSKLIFSEFATVFDHIVGVFLLEIDRISMVKILRESRGDRYSDLSGKGIKKIRIDGCPFYGMSCREVIEKICTDLKIEIPPHTAKLLTSVEDSPCQATAHQSENQK